MIRKVVSVVAVLLAGMAAPHAAPAVAPAAPANPSLEQAALFSQLAPNVKVAYVGVHEAASTGSEARKSSVRVNVGPDARPIVLVLSNYEPVNWIVSPGDRTIAAILLAGGPASTVVGHGNTPLIRVGHLGAHKAQSAEYLQLQREVGHYVRSSNQTFLGSYRGSEFSVR